MFNHDGVQGLKPSATYQLTVGGSRNSLEPKGKGLTSLLSLPPLWA